MIWSEDVFNDPGKVTCDAVGVNCQNTIANHKWGRIKSNWYFAKNGMAFCTEHLPDFVKEKRDGK